MSKDLQVKSKIKRARELAKASVHVDQKNGRWDVVHWSEYHQDWRVLESFKEQERAIQASIEKRLALAKTALFGDSGFQIPNPQEGGFDEKYNAIVNEYLPA